MRLRHKVISFVIVVIVAFLSYLTSTKLEGDASRSLVIFFSISFGLSMTCIGFMYNSSFAKTLYNNIDKTSGTLRQIHVVQKYFFANGLTSIMSISLIIYAPMAKNLIMMVINIADETIILLWSAIIYGISAANIFLMIILLKFALDGMVMDAKEQK